jgi:hypothetical protein
MRPPARGTITEYGYRRVRRPGSRRLVMEHVVVWEAHFGQIPKGMDVHHINGNKLDNRIGNLALLTRLEHKRVHSGCLRTKGVWWKRCRRCQWYRSIDQEFYVYPGSKGVMGLCKRCCIETAMERKKKKRLKLAAGTRETDTPEKTPAATAGVREGMVAPC